MAKVRLQTKGRGSVKTYVFRIVVEPDEDRWFAYAPLLKTQGAATWGYTREEAFKHIAEVVLMTVMSMVRHGESVPEESRRASRVVPEQQVAVAVS